MYSIIGTYFVLNTEYGDIVMIYVGERQYRPCETRFPGYQENMKNLGELKCDTLVMNSS